MCLYLRRPEEGVRSSRAGATGSYKQLDVGAGSRPFVLLTTELNYQSLHELWLDYQNTDNIAAAKTQTKLALPCPNTH